MAGDDAGEWPCTELPASWYWADFVTFFADHTDSQRKVPQKSYKQHGLIAVVDQGASKIGGFTNDLSMQSQAPLPAIVFGDHTRAVKYIDIPFAQGADGVRVLAARENVEPAFAYQALRCIKLPDKGYSRHFKFLKASRFPLAPLPEQRRIVAKIDSLTGKSKRACDHLDHIPRLVEKYKQAILAAAFRGDLTREWREGRSLAATRSVLLGEVAEGFNYGSAAKSAKQGRVPVLRMGNIQDGKLDWEDLVFTDDAAEIAKYRLKNGDVLFNRTNSPALVGKTALFTGKREAIYAGYLIKVRCKPQLLPAFLTYCLNAPNGRAYSWEVKTDGVSQSNINAKKLAAFRFDLPSVQEQEEIVRRIERALSWINRITVDTTSARKLIDHLDQSVLAKAFKGELVPQDPADEPASALLDRIRAERSAAPKAKRGRKKAA